MVDERAAGSEDPLVLVKREGPVTTLTLNRPTSLNALTRQSVGALRTAILEADAGDTRCIAITGAGDAFCAGLDLKADPAALEDLEGWLHTAYRPLVETLVAVRKPTVAIVNGTAAGVGFSLALACDLRLAANEAKFVVAFGRLGLVPDGGMTHLLPRLVGRARALEWWATNRSVTGAEAERLGLVNHAYPRQELVANAVSFCQTLAATAPLAYARTRELFEKSPDRAVLEAAREEEKAQGVLNRTDDHAEGLAAFRARRDPRFGGT